MSIGVQHLIALTITIMVEFNVIWIIIRKKPLELFIYSVLVNSLTLPLATYGYYYVLNNLFLIELIVVLAESLLLMILLRLKYPKALAISFAANFITALIGFLWNSLA